jgi:plastocyanin
MNNLPFLKRPVSLRRSIVLAAIGIAACLAILLAIGGIRHRSADAAAIPTIPIDNFLFSPKTLTIPLGASVTWINRDGDVHTVAADDTPQTFKSAGLDTDDKFSFTFTKPGTYSYHCSVHPHMTGKIIVR